MTRMTSMPSTTFDHMLWAVQGADGSWRRGNIVLGDCLLLFTSMDSLYGFLAGCEDREAAHLRPVVFSRSRKEFGRKAREAVRGGVVGALFDPAPGTGEAPFLRFAKTAK
jgi:hypothetical protein